MAAQFYQLNTSHEPNTITFDVELFHPLNFTWTISA